MATASNYTIGTNTNWEWVMTTTGTSADWTYRSNDYNNWVTVKPYTTI